MSKEATRYSNREFLSSDPFCRLSEISASLSLPSNVSEGREMLIRSLENLDVFSGLEELVSSLIRKAGLFPYLREVQDTIISASLHDQIEFEFHTPQGLDDIVLTTAQLNVYHALIEGQSVILSAPTSFGKSLLIDAMIATNMYSNIAIIVPTISLLDETRRRLTERFQNEYKIISHETQKTSSKNIFVFTQERFLNFHDPVIIDFFVVDEFYKISPSTQYNSDESDRTYVLNHAFYKLLKSKAQFFLIGPNIQDVNIAADNIEISFKFIRTNFSTVATEVIYVDPGTKSEEENAVDTCRNLHDPTLIFCKSKNSAYSLGEKIASDILNEKYSQPYSDLIDWLEKHFHKEWIVTKLLKRGVAVHHAGLPRALSNYILSLFNDEKIRFLLCTSTIIEGVNTVAKNIVIYDNKIATRKFDYFTFNNIKGRAGRMFQHYVGKVYVLSPPPQEYLPLVDFPALSQPETTPTSLLVHIEKADLSEHSLQKLKYLHAQNDLPLDLIRANTGVSPENQIAIAKTLSSNLSLYNSSLLWSSYPQYKQLEEACRLIFDLMGISGKGDVRSYKHLTWLLNQLSYAKGDITKFIEVVQNSSKNYTEMTFSESIEFVLSFLRNWCEYSVPKYLGALDSIQKHVFSENGMKPGDFTFYIQSIKQWFLPLSATVLEEYGLPFHITCKIEQFVKLGNDVDEVLHNIRHSDLSKIPLTTFERSCIDTVIENLD